MFHPKPHIWLNEYDPLYVLLRAVHRRDYQSSFDRFTQFIKSNSAQNSAAGKQSDERNKQLWPPFRLPRDLDSQFADPKKLLYSKVLHGFIFTILYRSLYTNDVSEQVLALTMFLLQLSLVANKPEQDSPAVRLSPAVFAEDEVDDLAFEDWFGSNWILENMNIIVQDIAVYEKSRPARSKNSSCILFGSDRQTAAEHTNPDENLEMEVDFLFPNEDHVNFNEDEYMMNDVENMMNERREYIERIDEMQPQLPSSTVPLAITESEDHSPASTPQAPSEPDEQSRAEHRPQQQAQSDENLSRHPPIASSSTSSSSSSNSLSSSSSAPLLAILSAAATGETTATTNQNNTPNADASSTNRTRNNLRLNTLTIQNLLQARSATSASGGSQPGGQSGETTSGSQLNSSYASGPSTSPQTRTMMPEVPQIDAPQIGANWVSSFNNAYTSTSIVPANQNSSLSPLPDAQRASTSSTGASGGAAGSSNGAGPSLPFLRRFHSQNRRNKYNRKRCSLEFNKQYHQQAGSLPESRMSICELLGTGNQPAVCNSSKLIKRKVTVNESLISLLLKLHSKLSGKQDSYQFQEDENAGSPANDLDNRIGDATHFIRQVLDLYCGLNASTGRQAIQTWKVKLWPFNYAKAENLDPREFNLSTSHPASSPSGHLDVDSPTSHLDKEERRRKAKERQQKLMAEFANKQKAFMKQMNEEFENQEATGEHDGAETMTVDVCNKLQYECVICGQTTPSTPERLIGMVVLLQSSSILAHCKPKYPIDTLKKTRSLLETEQAHEGRTQLIDEETVQLLSKQTLGAHMEERIDLLDANFNKSSWFNAINIGWEGGVHIQSCGHYLHLDCHCSYMQSLKASRMRGRNSSNDNGEFSCPLCRQMGNSVLPINPDINRRTNLKHYASQIRQFNLKRQDFSSVNRQVAKMFEGLMSNEDEDEDLMSNEDEGERRDGERRDDEQRDGERRDDGRPNDTENETSTDHNAELKPTIAHDECTVDSPIVQSPVDQPSSSRGLFSRSSTDSSSGSQTEDSLFRETCLELMSLYTRIPTPDSNLLKSFGFFCEDLTKATGPQYRSVKTSPTPHALYLFMCSILRTNLESELLVKLSKSAATGAKKSCFGKLHFNSFLRS